MAKYRLKLNGLMVVRGPDSGEYDVLNAKLVFVHSDLNPGEMLLYIQIPQVDGKWRHWHVDRRTVYEGLETHAGEGDVQVRPHPRADELLEIAISGVSEAGNPTVGQLKLDKAMVRRYLEDTYRRCPYDDLNVTDLFKGIDRMLKEARES